MSDRVASAEIEDVLSSIKRLVGEEGRKLSDLVPRSVERKPGRLVLTDALRVAEPAMVADEPDRPTPVQVADQTSYVEPELTPEPQSSSGNSAPMRLHLSHKVPDDNLVSSTSALSENAEVSNSSVQNEDLVLDEDVPEQLADSLSSKIEALEAAIAHTEDQWEPDGESDDAYSGTRMRAMEWGAGAALADSKTAAVDDESAATEPAAVESSDGPDSPAVFIRDRSADAEQPDQEGGFVESLGALDDEQLRALVSEIVHEELQGELGERITRNVRKMVRREIYRALAAQGLQ
ncbi:MAG: hypothetical protein ACR2O2_04410 [Ruegeria sp.]